MLLDGKINDDDEQDSGDTPSRAWAIGLGVCLVPVYILFDSFGMPGKGTAAAIALGTLGLFVRLHLELKEKVWFWGMISCMAVINGLIVIYVPFPNKSYTFPVVAPLGFADYLFLSACVRTIERVLTKK